MDSEKILELSDISFCVEYLSLYELFEGGFGDTGGAELAGKEGGAVGGTDGAGGGAKGGAGDTFGGIPIPGIANAGGMFFCIFVWDVGGKEGGTGGAEEMGGAGVLIRGAELGDDLCVLRIISSSSGFPLGAGVLGAAGADGADAATLSCSTGALVGADDFLATALSSTT